MLTKWIILLSCLPVFATAGYALACYRKLGRELQVFSWFLFLSGIIQLVSATLWWCGINNMPLLHFYVITGFACLAWFYKTVLQDFLDPRIIIATIILFTLYAIANSIFRESIYTFNSHALTVEAIILIIFALSTFMLSQHEIVRSGNMEALRGLNWINSGLFIFYASTILLYYFGNTITRSFPVYLSRYSWTLHSFFSVIMYSCFFAGLWKSLKK